ncbi:MAG TPA: metallophosphoesterase [Spirochaetota bacterium]|nr:metallophosphoesterase [Spirochaetota bacterium]HPJ34334.1 metallophosphoesterase [Spirochaetota bacterium]
MKIIYITDLHGAFTRLYEFFLETVADVYIIAGDLIDIPFYSIDTAINYHELQTYFNGIRRKMEREDELLEDFVDSLLDDPKTPGDIQDKGYEYQQATIRARRVMQQKYKVLENILSVKTNSEIFVLPGNYDMNLRYTALHERDLHLQWHEINGIRFAGYGGAETWSAGIPERYIVRYRAGINIPDKNNEMYTFFKAVRPDIIITHQPAHGIHDRLSWKGPSGSPALRTYCDNSRVKLCLTGHIHEDWGFNLTENTVFLNPSNFGEVITARGEVSEGGFFHEITFNGKELSRIQLKKFVPTSIFPVADYLYKDGNYIEEIIDQERFDALTLRENYDTRDEKYSHIPEIELFRDIRSYFRRFQTKESEKRMDELESMLEKITKDHVDIAFDVVGSLNMGLSNESSDVDMVVYLRIEDKMCDGECMGCEHYNKVCALLDEFIEDKYSFQIIDCINLNIVEKSIREENYECEITQRFVAHRALCRPVNYRIIAPVEDLLKDKDEFRKELEGTVRSFLKIFMTTTSHSTSFDKYITRLKTLGVKIPDSINVKIKKYLDGG